MQNIRISMFQEAKRSGGKMIRKFPNQRKFGLYSLTSHKRLGTFKSRKAAVIRERQIVFFKNKHEGGK
jgi:hypothetical protein